MILVPNYVIGDGVASSVVWLKVMTPLLQHWAAHKEGPSQLLPVRHKTVWGPTAK